LDYYIWVLSHSISDDLKIIWDVSSYFIGSSLNINGSVDFKLKFTQSMRMVLLSYQLNEMGFGSGSRGIKRMLIMINYKY